MTQASIPPIEFTWQIVELERKVADNAVLTIHYTVTATDGTHHSNAYGSIELNEPDPEEMIPFDELTLEIVMGWLKEQLGEKAVQVTEDSLLTQIAEQKAPSTATGLPWS